MHLINKNEVERISRNEREFGLRDEVKRMLKGPESWNLSSLTLGFSYLR